MDTFLNLDLNTLKASPEYEECKKEFKEAIANTARIETLEQNSEGYIFEYFADIKTQVDLRRKDL